MQKDNLVFLDFEFNNTKEKRLNVLCVAWEVWESGEVLYRKSLWFHSDKQKKTFVKEMMPLIDAGYTFVAWAVTAEASAFYSLGMHPFRKVQWLDLYLEYRMLTNKNNKYAYGKQMIKGHIKTTYPPKSSWDQVPGEPKSQKPEHNLAAATFKMLDKIIDTDHKDEMRQLCISNGPFSKQDKDDILAYCESDIDFLPELYSSITTAIKKPLRSHRAAYNNYFKDALRRGDYAARTAYMERCGHPFDVQATKNLSSHIPSILYQISEEITQKHPDVKPFLINASTGAYQRKEKNIRRWISDNFTKAGGKLDWALTEKGKASLALEAFADKCTIGDGTLGGDLLDFLKVQKAFNGFRANKKSSFWDYVGSDGRARPYMGIYGSQSARSQPSATSFIPLKASWMRVLIQPPRGYCYVSIDYSSQEFLIGALLSNDKQMQKAYHSGDPYIYTAILSGGAPKGATKESHPMVRDRFKSTVLGILFGMSKYGLADKLSNDLGVPHTEDEAQVLIDLFEQSYPTYIQWREDVYASYLENGFLRLPCGWIMFGDNDNKRSVTNCPVQGTGSSIMRASVVKSQDRRLEVAYTLHDELCVLSKVGDVEYTVDKLATAMDNGFRQYFPKHTRKAASCRLGAKIWGPDFKDGQTIDTAWFPNEPVSKKHIDGRGLKDYERFKEYLEYEDDIAFLKSLRPTPDELIDIL